MRRTCSTVVACAAIALLAQPVAGCGGSPEPAASAASEPSTPLAAPRADGRETAGTATPSSAPRPAQDGDAVARWPGPLTDLQVLDALDAGGARVVVDERLGYRLTLPDGWSVTDHTRGSGHIRLDLVRDADSGMQLRRVEGIGDDPRGYVERYAARYRDEMAGHHGGACDALGAEWSADGQAARIAFSHQRPGGDRWLLLLYVHLRDGDALVLQGGCPWAERDDVLGELDAVAGSLRSGA